MLSWVLCGFCFRCLLGIAPNLAAAVNIFSVSPTFSSLASNTVLVPGERKTQDVLWVLGHTQCGLKSRVF